MKTVPSKTSLYAARAQVRRQTPTHRELIYRFLLKLMIKEEAQRWPDR